VSFPQAEEGDKVRGKPEKFADHYTQATLFWESQTEWEQAHIAAAFRFELSKLTVPAIRARMVASLVNVAPELAAAVAEGLGIEVPPAMPKALAKPQRPEVRLSPALSLTALPGDGGIRTRTIAILVADGVHGASLLAVRKHLKDEGAVPLLIAPRLGSVETADGPALEADGTLENSPPVLFDALVLPDGEEGLAMLEKQGQTKEFVVNHYRHCKTILALGASGTLLDDLKVPVNLPDGTVDPGIFVADSRDWKKVVGDFVTAIGKHRHPSRDSDPPRV
jgi:catalase